MQYKKVMLIILDGFGVAPPSKGNAVSRAKMPYYDFLLKNYIHTTIQASGEEVGLPWRDVGNSEVGHGNLGAGRITYQSLPLINRAILDKSFYKNEVLLKAVGHAKKNNSNLHFMGLISSGGVHSHIEHLFTLMDLAKKNRIKKLFIHGFLDGRDTPKDSGIDFVKQIEKKIGLFQPGKIATLSGRFYAMDRDNNWDRIKKVYDAMVLGKGKYCSSPEKAVKNSYKEKVFDEEFIPTVIGQENKPAARVEKGDAIVFFNFRADRARELTKAFVRKEFKGFKRERIEDLFFVCLTQYEEGLSNEIAFLPRKTSNTLAEILSRKGLRQLHTAETEKFAHVTFFFNAGEEKPFSGEVHKIIPSSKVASYDKKPEMSARGVTRKVLGAIDQNYDFIIVNYANPDMVGHTGNLKATIKGLEFVDGCLKKICSKMLDKNGAFLVTADHGNCEEMINLQNGRIEKGHTANPVPLILAGRGLERKSDNVDLSLEPPTGCLADVSPTILSLLGVKEPEVMTGMDLSKVV